MTAVPKEILDKVHRIEIQAGRLVDDLFAGEYHSVFKGHGMEFAEVREYQPGDDVRAIDWNVTARAGGKRAPRGVLDAGGRRAGADAGRAGALALPAG